MNRRAYLVTLTVTWIGVFAPFAIWGFSYYTLPPFERAYSTAHDLFKPTGSIGHLLGFVGTGMIILGVVSYMVRKRSVRLQRAGKLRDWLSFHIFLCTLGPALVLLHTSFKFGGIVSISFWSMAIVVLSGLLGRYVYVRIPKTLGGTFRELSAVQEEYARLLDDLRRDWGGSIDELDEVLAAPVGDHAGGLFSALVTALKLDIQRRERLRTLKAILSKKGIPLDDSLSLAGQTDRFLRLSNQRQLLKPFSRLFHYWHTLHLPLAILMFLILAVHVGVAFAFGYF